MTPKLAHACPSTHANFKIHVHCIQQYTDARAPASRKEVDQIWRNYEPGVIHAPRQSVGADTFPKGADNAAHVHARLRLYIHDFGVRVRTCVLL